MIKKVSNIFFLLLTGFACAQTPTYLWAGRVGADSTDFPNAMVIDANGNVYTTGACAGTIDFDPGPGTYTLATAAGTVSPWASDMFVSKLDAAGNLLWARRTGNANSNTFWGNSGVSISADANGNVFVTGCFTGTVDFDPGPGIFNLTSPNSINRAIFILKLDLNGNFVWAKLIDGSYTGQTVSAVLDGSGNLFATGFFQGNMDMDPGPGTFYINSTSNFWYDSFILKLDGAGNFVFAKQLSMVPIGINNDGVYASGISLDVSGNIYASGYFGGTADFDPGPATNNMSTTGNSTNIYILKLDASGNFIWAKMIDGTGYSDLPSVLSNGNYAYLTGTYSGTMDFDPGPGTFSLSAVGTNTVQIWNSNAFVLKLDLAGNFVWAKNIASTLDSRGNSIAIDAASNVYTGGYFYGTADFDPGPGVYNIVSNGGSDGFILKLDAAGNYVWAETIGGVSDDWAGPISIGAYADIYMAGSFQSTADFDPGTNTVNLTSAGKEDIFILKWSQCSAAYPPLDLTPQQNKIICENTSASLFAYAANPIGWYASPTSTLALGTGTSYLTPSSSAGNYTYFAADPICAGIARTAISVTVDVCTGLQSSQASPSNVYIYPVPSSDGFLKVDVSSVKANFELKVYNILGEQIIEKPVLTNTTDLDLSKNGQGIYLVRLFCDNKPVSVQKIVIQ